MRGLQNTWRRHTCTRCSAVFTTRETVDVAHSYRIERADGSLQQFSRDQLYLSVHDALSHRSDAVTSSSALTDTIIARILKQKRLLIARNTLVDISSTTIKRFDRTAYVRYISLHGTR